MALAGLGKPDQAEAELTKFRSLVDQIPADTPFGFSGAQPVLKVAERLLTGKVEAAQGKISEAVQALREAAAAEDQLSYDEPPDWYIPTREALGALLLRTNDMSGAESVFREELVRHANNGRALWGLRRALAAEGKNEESARTEEQFQKAWKYADTKLTPEVL